MIDFATIQLTDWGFSFMGEHYSARIRRGSEEYEVDQVMTSGLAGRLNKKDGSRMNRPGDKTCRFETEESALQAAKELALEKWPDVKLITAGFGFVGCGNPEKVVYCTDKTIEKELMSLYNKYEHYYSKTNDPWEAGLGDYVDRVNKQWDETIEKLDNFNVAAVDYDWQLPPAYGGCTCPCHHTAGVLHCVPCCYPTDEDEKDD